MGAFLGSMACWFFAIGPLYLHCIQHNDILGEPVLLRRHEQTASLHGPTLSKQYAARPATELVGNALSKQYAARPVGELVGNDKFIWQCEDAHRFCDDWLKKGECVRNPAFMDVHCRKSCSKCDEPNRRFELADRRFEVGRRFTAAAAAAARRERTWTSRHDQMKALHRSIDLFVGAICNPGSIYADVVGLCVVSAGEKARGRTTPENPVILGNTADGGRDAQRDSYFNLVYQRTWGSTRAALCEVGFNAGHSAASMIAASPASATYIGFGFDAMRKRTGGGINGVLYARLNASLPSRAMEMTWGRSQETVVPFFAAKERLGGAPPGGGRCNVVSIDGSHAYDDVLSDLRNFRGAVDQRSHLIVADDTRCKSWFCEPPTKAWIAAIDEGLIRELACWEDVQKTAPKDWRTAPQINSFYRGWCVAEFILPGDGLPAVLDAEQAYARLTRHTRIAAQEGQETKT
jgi:hypothetical protein